MGKTDVTYIGGKVTGKKINEDLTDEAMAASEDKEKLTDTTRLGRYKPGKAVVETDPEKMSPLLRAAHDAAEKRKKKKLTTDDAAAALGTPR